jgi:hypothetical protein
VSYEKRPVFVEVTTKHVVWVYADDADEALQTVNRTPFYELIKDGETDVSTWTRADLPDGQYDWDEVYDQSYGGGYAGVECDAHVFAHQAELHRREWEARKATCTAAGHPDVEVYTDRTWCRGCSQYITVQTAEAGA